MAMVATAPGGLGGGTGGGGPPNGGPPGGGPPRGHYASGGDMTSELWQYNTSKAKDYLLEWLNRRRDRPVTVQFLRELAHFIWQLQAQGITLGPHLRLLAIHRDDDDAYLGPESLRFLAATPPTVSQLFGMGTQRGYYDTNLEATIQQSAGGNRSHANNNRCTRCQGGTGASRTFELCSQSYYQGRLLNFGACNECALNGNASRCTFYNRPATLTEANSPPLAEIEATQSNHRPQHPSFPSARVRARGNSNASAGSSSRGNRGGRGRGSGSG
ncbi:hypothetical protein NX059_002629 [Plenodomus lindquistii]|nr:hypothetical protein NX059_009264 [Plenodomus lindquistii]KAI8936158.1 hypothetical protein NX059_007653 [Plenodomus lindquistii]KAI8939781.1 hypothetical protein NX059_003522 [Plenodomus lindquistii]KAI8941406.1 hypothetical protein NX059_002629 [Plenodomus lindquistii]